MVGKIRSVWAIGDPRGPSASPQDDTPSKEGGKSNCNRNCNRNSNGNGKSNGKSNCNRNGNGKSNGKSNCNRNGNGKSNGKSNGNGNGNGKSNGNGNGNGKSQCGDSSPSASLRGRMTAWVELEVWAGLGAGLGLWVACVSWVIAGGVGSGPSLRLRF